MKRLFLISVAFCGLAAAQTVQVDGNLAITFTPVPPFANVMAVSFCFAPTVQVETTVVIIRTNPFSTGGPVQTYDLARLPETHLVPACWDTCFHGYWAYGDPANIKTVTYAINPTKVEVGK
jgi:hypothetical protein